MSARSTLRKWAAEERPRCPACGREVVGLATGQCIYCLQPIDGAGSRIEAGKILKLAEFDRARRGRRRSRGARGVRKASAGMLWLVLAFALIVLFMVSSRWLYEFFERGAVPVG